MNDIEKEKKPITSLFSDLIHNLGSLIQHEVMLAKTEMNAKISQIEAGGASLAIGGAVLYAGFLVLLLAAVLGLSYLVPTWLSALIIGLVVAVIGAGLVMKGRRDMKAKNLKPERTIESMRRNIDFTKEEFGRASR
jgi:xanthine/uracil permease